MSEFPNPYTTPLITVEQYARLIGVGTTTAYRHIRNGDIPTVRLTKSTVGIPTAKLYEVLGIPLPPAPSEDPVKH